MHANDNAATVSYTLHHDDCLDALGGLPLGSVDLFVTSPPYLNAGMSYGDAYGSEHAYVQFCREWMNLCSGLLTDRGSLWINVGTLFNAEDGSRPPLTYLLWPLVRELGLTLQQEVVWEKPGAMAHHKRFTMRSERWMWLTKKPTGHTFNLDAVRIGFGNNRTRDPRNNPLGKNPGDVWEYSVVNGASKAKTAHPCAFPVAMIERIILACSNPGETACDPFAGTGTTGEAALKHGRNAILIEREARYCDIIRERLDGVSPKAAA